MADTGPNILIVGAGAVGQVYGSYLHAGGARLSVLVKPKYGTRALEGYTLHRLRWLGAPQSTRLEKLAVFTDVEALRSERFDQVWLCVPSDALSDASWLRALADATRDATIVSQHGGPEDAARVHAAAGRERTVHGPILLLAYSQPLNARDTWGKGTRYFIPPAPHGFSSASPGRAQAVVRTLAQGGLWARTTRDAEGTYRRNAAVLIPLVAALELSDWSFSRLRRSRFLCVALDTARECLGALHAQGGPLPLWRVLLRVPLARLCLRIAPRVAPVPLEAFFRYHFTKVGPQTEVMLAGHQRALAQLGRAQTATAALLDALREQRHARSS